MTEKDETQFSGLNARDTWLLWCLHRSGCKLRLRADGGVYADGCYICQGQDLTKEAKETHDTFQ